MAGPTPWRLPLDAALSANAGAPASRFVQLATVRADGRPANRTVVFRRFLDPGDRLVFWTDLRGAKVGELTRDPWAEVCWAFAETREQFRLLGRVAVAGGSGDPALAATRAEVWRETAEGPRQSLTWPQPGEPRADAAAFERPAPPVDAPPPSFALIVLSAERVDHLDTRPRPHERTVYERGAGGWATLRANP